MDRILRSLLEWITSLKLTIICLGLAMVLIFVGTLDQVNLGIHAAQKKYFESLFVYWAPAVLPFKIPVLPGGYLLGTILLVNLVAAHATRFRLSWKKSGIFLLHSGVVLLLLGQLLTQLFAREGQMSIDEGKRKNYSESFELSELAIVDTSASDHDEVVSIPTTRLARGEPIVHPLLSFVVKPVRYFRNARLTSRAKEPQGEASLATEGLGPKVVTKELPVTYNPKEKNMPTAFVELSHEGKTLGTWLVSEALVATQPLSIGGKTFQMQIRPTRSYKPYWIQLLDFRYDRYTGTSVPLPRNYSSRVRLTNPSKNEDREVLVYMNNPLRYDGETYYQASFDDKTETTTVFQVVRNPSWILPYVSCTLVGVGLLVQFLIHLVSFMRKRTVPA